MGSNAFTLGWQTGARSYGEALARKQALSDEEFHEHARLLADELAGNREQLSKLNPQQSPEQYANKINDLRQNLANLRELYHPDRNPNAIAKFGHLVTDALHITNPQQRIRLVAKRRADASANDEQQAQELARSTPQQPNEFSDYKSALIGAGFTPEQAQKALEVRAGIEARPIAPKPILKEFQQIGNPRTKAWLDATRPIPAGWTATGGSMKPTKGTLVRSAQSSTGFAQTWVDPMNPSQIVGWQPVTPSRYYQGTVSTASNTDPFGVTTTSTRTTQPTDHANVDLSSVTQLPPSAESDITDGALPETENAPAETPSSAGQARGASPTAPRRIPSGKVQSIGELRKQAAARAPQSSSQLDAQGHIAPAPGLNEGLRTAANQLLDGMDLEKLPLPARDRQAAAAIASRYGWGGQGLFNPQQKLLIREAKTYLSQALNDPALKVLDSYESRVKLVNAIHAAKDNAGLVSKAIASRWDLNPQEEEFLRLFNQLSGTISGLGQLTRGGRITEATVGRLLAELPNPTQSHSSADAKQRINRLLSEIDVAVNQGQGIDARSAGGGSGSSAEEFLKNFRAKEKQ